MRTTDRTLFGTITSSSFIRFDSIESAEKCIEALRRYRNLHPSFCKAGVIFLCRISVVLNTQRFRTFIPFLALAMLLFHLLAPRFPRLPRLREQMAILLSHEWSDSRTSLAPICTSKGFLSVSMSLYVFLEYCLCSRLDASLFFYSLNQTMAALVAPFTIKSSRFFQTRLSHPPRTIAFVRFDRHLF